MSQTYDTIKNKARTLFDTHDFLKEPVTVTARALTVTEAIGSPEHDDYPIQKGKEKLMQADFRSSYGQAFTDHFGHFEGTVQEVLDLPLTSNFQRAVLVSTINAVMRHLSLADRTIHCHDDDPKACADGLVAYIKEKYGTPKITQIGLQPRMAEALSPVFPLRLIDLDPDNIGRTRNGVTVEGEEQTEDAIDWCDLLLVTGTVITNSSIDLFLNKKPVLFYGTTIAGPAQLMGWDRFCKMAT